MMADNWRTTENIALEELPCQIVDMMSPTSAGKTLLNLESLRLTSNKNITEWNYVVVVVLYWLLSKVINFAIYVRT